MAEGARDIFLSKNRPYQVWAPRRLLFNGRWFYFTEIRRTGCEFDHRHPSNAEVNIDYPLRLMTSIGVTFHYLASKLLVLIEDHSVSTCHMTFTQRCCRRYKNVSQTTIQVAKFLFIIFTTLPPLGYSNTFIVLLVMPRGLV